MSGHSVSSGIGCSLLGSLPLLLAAACGGSPEASEVGDTPAPALTGPEVAGSSDMAATSEPPADGVPAEGTPPGGVAPSAGDSAGFIDDPNASEPTLKVPDLDDMTACAGLELIPDQVEVEVPMEITTTTEVLQPVAFYIVLDNSSSMQNRIPATAGVDAAAAGDGAEAPDDDVVGVVQDPVNAGAQTGMTRWEVAVSSLQSFVTAPESEGLDVAIQYFNPPGQGGPGQGVAEAATDPLCDGSFHGTPDVEMGRLPDNAQALVASLDAAQTATGTPTLGALTGGIAYCQAFEAEHPDEKCVVVLVTDGLPSSCGLNGNGRTTDAEATDVLVQIASAGLGSGIETFTVGMDGVPPEGFTLLDAVAAAGGTDCTPEEPGGESCNVSTSGAAGLVATLSAIRDTVTITETVTEVTTVIETQKLECQWVIPPPPADEKLDPRRVNVNLSVGGAEPTLIPSVKSQADCEANAGVGWYYDNPDAPTTIYACAASCSQIQEGVNPVVNILLGCETVFIEVMR